ncbi:hypothetical protein ACFOD9_12850 [Novosphingobium bradum]|uniref:Uncharacterized protein n=1 Tax=Novosphingobium bradum TaxID=1737444 RepID=A0ABV7IR39_9SPHN
MATPPPASSTAGSRATRRGLRRLGWAIVAGLVALALLYGPALARYARTGTSYGARIGCSCRFVEGRPLGSCRADFEPGMALVTLSEDAEARSVTARFALGFAQTATFREGAGCQMDPLPRD